MLSSIPFTRDRGLSIRTYQVVPLSPVVGMAQWVTGTTTLAEFVIGKSKDAKSQHRLRYFPNDMTNDCARECLLNARDPSKVQLNGNSSTITEKRLLFAFRHIINRFHPVMDHRLMETFTSPQTW